MRAATLLLFAGACSAWGHTLLDAPEAEILLEAGASHPGASHQGASPAGARVARNSPLSAWLQLIGEYGGAARAGAGGDGDGDQWFPRPVPLTLPLGRGADNRPVSVPVLVLPVPVPAPAHPAPAECSSRPSSHPSQTAPQAPGRFGSREELRPIVVSNYDDAPPAEPPTSPAEPLSPPRLDYVVSSRQLVDLFREQVAPHPELPPMLIPDYATRAEGREPADDGESVPPAPGRSGYTRLVRRAGPPGPPPAPAGAVRGGPATPRYDRSVMVRGQVTVGRAGYTEPYTVWWDAATGAARVDLHGGATSAYRTPLADGRVQLLEVRTDRTGAAELRRCARSAPRPPSAADRALPALPDMTAFTFAGYVESNESAVVERWTRSVQGGAGELGAARGEALLYRHEVLVARAPDQVSTTPLRYSVSVDSSVLGPACDGYVHRYTELREHQPSPSLLRPEPADACDDMLWTDRRDRLEPLAEFTMLTRDPRYDTEFQQFKSSQRRSYWDDTEEALRKNLFMQHTRFISSGNRQGATSDMEMNYLGDRLDAEKALLNGVSESPGGSPGERFPYSGEELMAARARLPRRFDWRDLGAVTPARYQDSCSTCWAFAVTASVEGALFARTRRLVPLSEQVLLDCAQPFGANGCGRSWPSSAFDYVTARGLPPLKEYPSYQNKVSECKDREVEPVTHISSYVNVTKNSVQALKVAIKEHAPTVVIIDATTNSFIFHKKGVLYDDRCSKTRPHHAVTAVGWGEHRGQTFFVIKNSWGDKWGDAGFGRLSAPSNTCGVLSRPSYPRLEAPRDVDRLPS